MKLLPLLFALPLVFALPSCETHNHYPVVVETPKPKPVVRKPIVKPKPKPVESAEGFRAVERPGSYSN